MDLFATNTITSMKTYLSVTEIAKVTEKERSTIVRWVKAGKFGNVRKLGNEYQIPHKCFKQWWDQNMNDVPPQKGGQ